MGSGHLSNIIQKTQVPFLSCDKKYKVLLSFIHHRGESAPRKHLREQDQKVALSSETRKGKSKARISKNLGHV